jgi:hypothetical protein
VATGATKRAKAAGRAGAKKRKITPKKNKQARSKENKVGPANVKVCAGRSKKCGCKCAVTIVWDDPDDASCYFSEEGYHNDHTNHLDLRDTDITAQRLSARERETVIAAFVACGHKRNPAADSALVRKVVGRYIKKRTVYDLRRAADVKLASIELEHLAVLARDAGMSLKDSELELSESQTASQNLIAQLKRYTLKYGLKWIYELGPVSQEALARYKTYTYTYT